MGSQLASVYVSVLAETSKIKPAVKAAFADVEKDAKKALGGYNVLATKVGQEAGKGLATGVATSHKSILASATKLAAGFTAAFSAQKIGSDILRIGTDYQKSLNTMGAVSNATSQQMAKVNAKARELGKDVTLFNTSASDAAQAMTELAKGGFSVDQSMTAAKGTLQLAAAAQISAAEAATIQAQTIQAFGLKASDASKVADVLAGSANASSANISDMGLALRQASAVSHTFGISMDDTITSIAMFANAGIVGSDAGTLMKTMLLSLTDTGKPAQQAIQALGLQLRDAKGNFVGIPALIDQLAKARKKLNPKEFEEWGNKLFGSDAFRAAGIFSEKSSQDFEKLKRAVTRAGQAQQLAAAQTTGLPGAIERIRNQTQDTYLAVFDQIQAPAVKLLDGVTKSLAAATPTIGAGFQSAVSGVNSFVEVAGKVVSVLQQFPPLTFAAVAALLALKKAFNTPVGTQITGSLKSINTAYKEVNKIAKEQGVDKVSRLTTAAVMGSGSSSPTIAAASNAFLAQQAKASKEIEKLNASAAKSRNLADFYKGIAATTGNQYFAQIGKAASQDAIFLGMQAKAERMSATVKGALASSFSVAKSAASGLLGVLGGPWGAAFTAATIGISTFVGANQQAAKTVEALKQAQVNAASTSKQYVAAVAQAHGERTDLSQALAQRYLKESAAEFLTVGEQAQGFKGRLKGGFGLIGQSDGRSTLERMVSSKYLAEIDKHRKEYKAFDDALKKAKLTQDEFFQHMAAGDSVYNDFQQTLREAGKGGQGALEYIASLDTGLKKLGQAAVLVKPQIANAVAGIDLLTKQGATADEKNLGANSLVDLLNPQLGGNTTVASMAAGVQQQIDTIKQVASQANLQTLFDDMGALNIKGNVDAPNVQLAFKNLRDQVTDSVVNGGADLNQTFDYLNNALGTLKSQVGLTDADIEKLFGNVTNVKNALSWAVKLQGMDQVTTDLVKVKLTLDSAPDEKQITINTISQPAQEALTKIGFKVQELANQPGLITVTAETEDARQKLNQAAEMAADLKARGKDINLTVLMDPTPVNNAAAEVKAAIDSIKDNPPTIEAGNIVKQFEEGIALTQGQLQYLQQLNGTSANPTVKVNGVEESQAAVTGLEGSLQGINRTFTATVQVKQEGAVPSFFGAAPVSPNTSPAGSATGGLFHYANGGWHKGYTLPTSGPGSEVTDGFPAVNQQGVPVAMLDAGEWVINAKSSRKYHRILKAINAGTYPQFAAGGGINLASAGVGTIDGNWGAVDVGTAAMFTLDPATAAQLTQAYNQAVAIAAMLSAAAAQFRDEIQTALTGVKDIASSIGAESLGSTVDVFSSVLDAQKVLSDYQDQRKNRMDDVIQAEKALADAQEALADSAQDSADKIQDARDSLANAEDSLNKAKTAKKPDQGAIDKAQRQVDKAKRNLAKAERNAPKDQEEAAYNVEQAKDKLLQARSVQDVKDAPVPKEAQDALPGLADTVGGVLSQVNAGIAVAKTVVNVASAWYNKRIEKEKKFISESASGLGNAIASLVQQTQQIWQFSIQAQQELVQAQMSQMQATISLRRSEAELFNTRLSGIAATVSAQANLDSVFADIANRQRSDISLIGADLSTLTVNQLANQGMVLADLNNMTAVQQANIATETAANQASHDQNMANGALRDAANQASHEQQMLLGQAIHDDVVTTSNAKLAAIAAEGAASAAVGATNIANATAYGQTVSTKTAENLQAGLNAAQAKSNAEAAASNAEVKRIWFEDIQRTEGNKRALGALSSLMDNYSKYRKTQAKGDEQHADAVGQITAKQVQQELARAVGIANVAALSDETLKSVSKAVIDASIAEKEQMIANIKASFAVVKADHEAAIADVRTAAAEAKAALAQEVYNQTTKIGVSGDQMFTSADAEILKKWLSKAADRALTFKGGWFSDGDRKRQRAEIDRWFNSFDAEGRSRIAMLDKVYQDQIASFERHIYSKDSSNDSIQSSLKTVLDAMDMAVLRNQAALEKANATIQRDSANTDLLISSMERDFIHQQAENDKLVAEIEAAIGMDKLTAAITQLPASADVTKIYDQAVESYTQMKGVNTGVSSAANYLEDMKNEVNSWDIAGVKDELAKMAETNKEPQKHEINMTLTGDSSETARFKQWVDELNKKLDYIDFKVSVSNGGKSTGLDVVSQRNYGSKV